jgi:phage terminase small subunit
MLKPKQIKFADAVIATGNATEAAILAGYSQNSAAPIGSRLLKNPNIIQYIESQKAYLQQRTNTSLDNVLNEYACIAFSNIKKVLVEKDEIEFKNISDIDDNTAKAIQEIIQTPTKYGLATRVKFYDKINALDKICKIHAYYISIYEILDKMETSQAAQLIEKYINKKKENNIKNI